MASEGFVGLAVGGVDGVRIGAIAAVGAAVGVGVDAADVAGGVGVGVAELAGGVGVATGIVTAADEQPAATNRPMIIVAGTSECDRRISCASGRCTR